MKNRVSGEISRGKQKPALVSLVHPDVKDRTYSDTCGPLADEGCRAYGELLIGIGLIVGALVGVTAFFAAFMNRNFMMAGFASTNLLLFVLATGLLLAWRVSGQIGIDYLLYNRERVKNVVRRWRSDEPLTA